jgi:hypothetical protein
VQFTDSNTGWIAGYSASLNKAVLLKTTNGGVDWEEQLTNIKPWLHSVYFVDSENGWAVGSGGTIISTKDISLSVTNEHSSIPNEYKLLQNYPNPFNPTTKIIYEIVDKSYVSLTIYDILGKEVATLVNQEKPAGEYEVKFSGKDLTSGIYFYNLTAGNFRETKKMLLLK